jgi:hypothetical protein
MSIEINLGATFMSNHSGSRMLNKVITILDRQQVFSGMDKETAQKLIKEIAQMASLEYDCNQGEILEGHTQQFNLCSYCLSDTSNLDDGLCATCGG